MAKSEAFEKAVFELGDKARDLLAQQSPPMPAMERVFDAEERVLANRQELEDLENELNEVDTTYRTLLAHHDSERASLQPLVKKFRRAVDGIDGKVKDLRKKLASARAEARMSRDALKAAEARQNDLEMSGGAGSVRAEQGRQSIKRQRVNVLRKEREITELEGEMAQALTPVPGQPGAEGIEAHRRLLEMEDEATTRKDEVDRRMAELDVAIADKEAELQDSEAELSEALYLLGEACYQDRVRHPQLDELYRRLDKLG